MEKLIQEIATEIDSEIRKYAEKWHKINPSSWCPGSLRIADIIRQKMRKELEGPTNETPTMT